MPKQEYKFEPIIRKGKKGGIDAVAYRDKILLPLLHPFYEQVRDAHPDREVWLIEDNGSSHQKAAKMCYHEREIRGILKVDWPANSPDLHPIEDVWFYEKSLLAPKWKELRGAGKNEQEKARKEIGNVWKSEEILAKTKEITSGWRSKLQKCSDQNGQN